MKIRSAIRPSVCPAETTCVSLAATGTARVPATPSAPPPREPLSERELAVLRFLPTMLTSQEIAGELFVTLNTVKSHLRNVYRKLGVNNRRQLRDALFRHTTPARDLSFDTPDPVRAGAQRPRPGRGARPAA